MFTEDSLSGPLSIERLLLVRKWMMLGLFGRSLAVGMQFIQPLIACISQTQNLFCQCHSALFVESKIMHFIRGKSC